jgi:hypothetical protein
MKSEAVRAEGILCQATSADDLLTRATVSHGNL